MAETQAGPIVSDELSQIPNYSNRVSTDHDVHRIRHFCDHREEYGYTFTQIGRMFGMSKSAVINIWKRESWSWLPEQRLHSYSQREIIGTLDFYESRLDKCNHSGAGELK